jgi:exonuclease SbcD
MRLLHTSDWHLGHTLHGVEREYEHARFFDWLIETCAVEAIDALLVAGDLYDAANPPAAAEAAWYDFVARLRRRLPRLELVVIGGNHDSAARLDAPSPLYRALDLHVVGSLAGPPERLVVPLHDAAGQVRAWVAAVPFLRPSDLPPASTDGAGDALVEGVRRVYAEVLEAARARRQPGQALVAMGHLYMVGTRLSELSERKILGGNQHALPVDLFPDDLAYAALGHLHLGQPVGGRPGVRYCGSPLPLSLAEADYAHQVCVVELDGERLGGVRTLPVPRAVDILRLPPMTLDELLPRLRALEVPELDEPRRPLLEVRVVLTRPEPGLRHRVEEALLGRPVRLVRVGVEYTGDGRALAEARAGARLGELSPAEVFVQRWRRDHEGDPPPALAEAFARLAEDALDDGARA